MESKDVTRNWRWKVGFQNGRATVCCKNMKESFACICEAPVELICRCPKPETEKGLSVFSMYGISLLSSTILDEQVLKNERHWIVVALLSCFLGRQCSPQERFVSLLECLQANSLTAAAVELQITGIWGIDGVKACFLYLRNVWNQNYTNYLISE